MKIFLKPSISNFFFISLIAFHLSPCFSKDTLHLVKACGVGYDCGGLGIITYPFWGNGRPGFFGRPEFELKCNNNGATTIQINSMEYIVLVIDQSHQIMRIARSDLFDNYCPQSQIQRTATLGHSLFVYSSDNQNISMWYNC